MKNNRNGEPSSCRNCQHSFDKNIDSEGYKPIYYCNLSGIDGNVLDGFINPKCPYKVKKENNNELI